MGAWQAMYARASASQFLPHNSAANQYLAVLNMQLDVEFEKEQIGTLFVWVGLVLGPRGGGCQRGPPQNLHVASFRIFFPSWLREVNLCNTSGNQL